MASLRDLKRRIRSVQSTKQITRAMEMVAAAKLTRSRKDVEAARPYGQTMQAMLGHISEAGGVVSHALFEKRSEGARVLAVFSSDRGLCGAFNTNVVRRAVQYAADHAEESVRLVFVGRKAWDFFQRRDYEIAKAYRDIGTGVELTLAQQVTDDLVELFTESDVRSVDLLYSRFVSTLTRTPVVETLLPIEPPAGPHQNGAGGAPAPLAGDAAAGGERDYIFEPSPEAIFRELLPRYALTRVVAAFLESFASEHSARMVAMGSATKNADELIDALVLKRNRIRQAIITTEIAELVGGAEALA